MVVSSTEPKIIPFSFFDAVLPPNPIYLSTFSSSSFWVLMMGRLVTLLNRLLPLLLFLLLGSLLDSEATSTSTNTSVRLRLPGFVFTRNRGKCSSQYWSSKVESWPKMVPRSSSVSKMFGSLASERFRYDLTLEEATARNDDQNPFSDLLKHAVAALLNSYSRKGFPYRAWEVKTMVMQGLVSENTAVLLAKRFAIANEACN